jgi:hypothetical protein
MKRLLFAFLSVFMLCYCVWADESAPDVGLLNHCGSKDCQARIQLAWMGVVSVGGSGVSAGIPSGITVIPTWSFGESVLHYNTTAGIDPHWSFGESVILDIKE